MQHLSNAEFFSLTQENSCCKILDCKALNEVLNWCLALYTQSTTGVSNSNTPGQNLKLGQKVMLTLILILKNFLKI